MFHTVFFFVDLLCFCSHSNRNNSLDSIVIEINLLAFDGPELSNGLSDADVRADKVQ